MTTTDIPLPEFPNFAGMTPDECRAASAAYNASIESRNITIAQAVEAPAMEDPASLPDAPDTTTSDHVNESTSPAELLQNIEVISPDSDAGLPSPDLLPELQEEDLAFRAAREQLVSEALNTNNAAAKALYEIYSYRDGILWRKEFASFAEYCKATWGQKKAHCYRLLKHGRFLDAIAVSNSNVEPDDAGDSQSPHGDYEEPLEGQVRPLLSLVPKELQVECWNEIVAVVTNPTSGTVKKESLKFLGEKGIESKLSKPSKSSTPLEVSDQEAAARDLKKLRMSLARLAEASRFEHLLDDISELISQQVDNSVEHAGHEAA